MPLRLAGRLARADRPSPGDHCPVDRAVQVVGSRSAMLLLREASYGTTRFDDFARRAGITDAVAAARLRDLVAAGLLERRPYREPGQRTRHEYVLTPSGVDLVPVVLGLAEWGRRHAPRDHTPTYTHADCGAAVTLTLSCAEGHLVTPDDVVVRG